MWNAYVRPEGAETVGSMDLGGASTQIAFAIQEDFKGPDYLHVKLYGYPYTVYTHSFLCYGKNEAEKQVLDRVIKVNTFFFLLHKNVSAKTKNSQVLLGKLLFPEFPFVVLFCMLWEITILSACVSQNPLMLS